MDLKAHWENVYTEKLPTEVSWYQAEPRLSLELIAATGIAPDARIVDVGGGACVLVERLVQTGFRNITVLDISSKALHKAQERLGDAARQVEWIEADITQAQFAEPFDLWHDRAVFHFLTEPESRREYVGALMRGLKPGGHLIMATFAPDGPARCSGLDVVRYSAAKLSEELGSGFTCRRSCGETHATPWGKPQQFIYCWFQRSG